MKKLQIAIMAKRFPKIYETFVLNHIVALIKRGHDVDIFSLRKPYSGEVQHEAVERYSLLKKTHYFSKTNRSLDKKYDIVHCHFGNVGTRMARLKEIYPNSRLFVTFHGYDVRMGLKKGGKFYQRLFQNADGVIAICEYNREQLLALGCPPSKIILLPNGVDLKQFTPAHRPKNSRLIITTVARFTRTKNIPFALRVMKAIKEEQKFDFQYFILGDGKQRKIIDHLIDEYDLRDHVVLCGMATQKEVFQILNRTDLFFLPSLQEAFPVCLLEAQAMAIPPVSTNVGGVSETIQDGRTGFLVDPDDVSQAKDRIDCLLADRNLRESMGTQGRLWVEQNFSIVHLNEKLWRIYEA